MPVTAMGRAVEALTLDRLAHGAAQAKPRACFFAHLGDCEGRKDRAHLVPRRLLKVEFRYGANPSPDGGYVALRRGDQRVKGWYSCERLIRHPQTWVWACRSHHTQLDVARTIRIAREDLPVGFVELMRELGMEHFVDREYGGERWT